jgi:hypothetical protein
MKLTLRTIAATTALALTFLGLTGCTDTDDCDDAAGTSPGTVAVAAHLTTGKGSGRKSGKSRSGSGKSKPRHGTTHHHDSDDCEDDD